MLLLLGACTFDGNTVGENQGAPDARIPAVSGSRDGGLVKRTDASRDEIKPDSGPATCQSLYGEATNYDLCEETATSCRFYVLTNEETCNNLCAKFGGACIDNYDGNCGSDVGSQGCGVVHYDQVCICSKP